MLLSSMSSSSKPLSSSLGWRSGTEGKGGLSHCLWVLSVTENLAPCLPNQLCPPVALTLNPDSHTYCKVSTNLDLILHTDVHSNGHVHVQMDIRHCQYLSLYYCLCMLQFVELLCVCLRWSSSFPGQWSCTFGSQPDWGILRHYKDPTYHCGGHLRYSFMSS